MLGFMELLIAFIALPILGIAAQLFAVDSRDGFVDQPRPDLRDLPSRHS
jgi:hypothetical protein